MFKIFKKILIATSLVLLAGCSDNSTSLKVGTIAGPETELMQVAKKVAKDRFNLNIKIVEFTDYAQPNAALSDGSIDANMFQHQPYLDKQIKDHKYKLVAVGKTFVYPMAIYSKKLKNISEIHINGTIAIPNDPSNEGRALLLAQEAGLIRLKNGDALYATPADISYNSRNLKFVELDAAQLARSLPDVDAAIINTNYAIPAGLSPLSDSIYREGSDSPYANIIVVREDEVGDPRITQLVQSLQSQEVLKEASKIFNDQAIPAW